MSDDNDNIDLYNEIKKLTIDPLNSLKELRKDFTNFERSVTDQKYQYLAMTAALFYAIISNEKLKIDFLKLISRTPKKKGITRKSLLLLVFRYVLKAPAEKCALYERARVYARAMQSEIDKQTDPVDIPAAIRAAGGIEEMYARREGSKYINDDVEDHSTDEVTEHDDLDRGDPDEDDEEDESGAGTTSAKPDRTLDGTKKPARLFNPRKDLSVSCETENEMAEVLESRAGHIQIFATIERTKGNPPKLLMTDWTEEWDA